MSIEQIQSLSLVNDLSPDSVDLLADLATIIKLPAHQVLFREGQSIANVYWIKQGRVRLEMSGTRSGSKAMLTIGTGDLLAWSAVLSDGRMTATATTLEPTELVSFDSNALLRLCEENCEIGFKVMHTIAKLVSKRLLATRLQLLDLFHSPGQIQ